MKKFLLGLGLTISFAITISVPAIYFFPHVFWIQYARYQFPKAKYSEAYEKPLPRPMIRPDTKIDLSRHQSFSLGTLTFNTPWLNEIGTESTTRGVLHSFPGARSILLPKPGGFFISKEVKTLLKDKSLAEQLFGKKMLSSNFLTHKQIFESSLGDTPKDRVEMVRMMTLSVLKAISYPIAGTPGAHSFTANEIRGWQFGRPKQKKAVILEFYNRQDVYHVMVLTGMTQREIDFIIGTIRERGRSTEQELLPGQITSGH